MKFKLQFDLYNSFFDAKGGNPDPGTRCAQATGHVLREVARRVTLTQWEGVSATSEGIVSDGNGNTIGYWWVERGIDDAG